MALVIFDYDGVLADTLADLLRVGQEACNTLGIKHVTTTDDLSSLEEMSFASYGRACGVPEPLVEEFVRICLRALAEGGSPPPIFTGLSTVVRDLSLHHSIAVVTTNSSQNVNAFLVKHGLDGLVHAVYGVDSPGSKAQKMLMARNGLSAGKQKEPAYMVGDSLSDILAAREASLTSIAATWGHQSLGTLLRGNPDYVVNAPHELLEIIEQ